MWKRALAVWGLLMMDLGVFAMTAVWLPRALSYGFSGPWSRFVNARVNWDIAWGMLVASLILSVGIYLLMEALGAFDEAG